MSSRPKALGLMSLTAIGIGGMVGGGIFAVLGIAVSMAGSATPLAFLFSGSIALVTSYSYAKLSSTYPSEGGTVAFIIKAFGTGTMSGGLNIMLWLSYVIMISLYAYTFGSYGVQLFSLSASWAPHVLSSLAILVFMSLNVLSASIVGKTEEVIVFIKVSILLVFIAFGISGINTSTLSPSSWVPYTDIVVGGMLIFVAYEGFELISNAANDASRPGDIPRALYISVSFVICLYVLIALVAVGSVSVSDIVASRDYALAKAAEPFLGSFGFSLIAVAALLSTSSAINATLYGAARTSYTIARDGELPEKLEHKVWNKPIEGLFITTILALVLVNTLDLSRIATLGSLGFIVIFAAVNLAHLRLHKTAGGRGYISAIGVVSTTIAFVLLLRYSIQNDPVVALMFIAYFFGCLAVERIYSGITKRSLEKIRC
ncbi:MAG TPA: APC family permease [Candidatus Methanofastidiosa archaeon]|nr:APC family permease [Candidatus Methanofastidiosa archaeon]